MTFKIFRVLMALTLLLLSGWAIGGEETDTWTVCREGCDFTSIQEAIEAAGPGDIVIVNPETAVVFGHYVENIVIDKPITLAGQGDDWPPDIRAKDDDQPVILVKTQVEGVIIRGFEIRGGAVGISVKDDAQVTIQSNSIIENGIGIDIGAAKVVVHDNFISQNWRGGINIGWWSEREGTIEIIHNVMVENDMGIEAFMPGGSSSLVVIDNSINRAKGKGIWILTGGSAELRGNVIVGNEEDGIIISFGEINIINNVIAGNWGYGVGVIGLEVAITENTITGNDMDGVVMASTPDFTAKFAVNRNKIRLNRRGIALYTSSCYEDEYDGLTWLYVPSGIAADPFNGEISGGDNIVEGSYASGLCPEDYPWPEGFVKGP